MTVKLSPIFQGATLDINGNPWDLAKLFTYVATSSTKQTTYQDSAGSTPHSNPIILNSRGEPPAPIWLTSGVSYKFVLTSPSDSDPPVAATRTVDSVSGVNDASTTSDEWVSGPAPTYVSSTSFTLVGDQTSTFTVGRRVKVTDSGGTKYGTILTSAFTTLTTLTLSGDALATPTSAVSYGLLNPTNSSLPVRNIPFPATQVASSDVNTLDDYEEGTWVPSLGGSTTYAVQTGIYVKIGKAVYWQLALAITLIGTGSTVNVSGLPFTSAASLYPGSVSSDSVVASSVVSISCHVSGSTVVFNSRLAAATSASSNAIFGNSAVIYACGFYFV